MWGLLESSQWRQEKNKTIETVLFFHMTFRSSHFWEALIFIHFSKIGPTLTFTKPRLSFSSGDSSSQQHLSHADVLVLQEPGPSGSVSGGGRCGSGGEDQTAHGERPGEQRGLGHSKRIREWTASQGWKQSHFLARHSICTKLETVGPIEKSLFFFCCCCRRSFQMDLMPFVNKAGCECLNESDDCGFDNCLIKNPSYLESDCDEQVWA